MLLFDIGANRGDATLAGLKQGYKVIALEPAPRVYAELVKNFIYNPDVTPLRLAIAGEDGGSLDFYEADEDGLSTLNKNWLTSPEMPYNGKPFRTIKVPTMTLDTLAELYGEPDLIKIDVEGAEWSVFLGMSKHHGKLAFEWTQETLAEHDYQLEYLRSLGYKEYKFQFIEQHLKEPGGRWHDITPGFVGLEKVRKSHASYWESEGWKRAGLRPTADVGMLWVQ